MDQRNQPASDGIRDEQSQLKDLIFCTDGSGKVWQEGWYIYQDGKIQGPLSLMEALTRPYFGTDQQAVLISRRGYGQWYELSFLGPKITPQNYPTRVESAHNKQENIDIMRTRSSPGSLTKKNIPAVDLFDSNIESVASSEKVPLNLKNGDRFPNEQVAEKTSQRGQNKKQILTGKHPSFTPSLVKPIFPKKNADDEKNIESNPESSIIASRTAADLAYQDYTPAVMPSVHRSKGGIDATNDVTIREKIKNNNPPTKGEIIQEYFISRKKLRLGNIRSSLIFGGIGYVCSFGLIWGFWVIQSLREIEYHCDGKTKSSLLLTLIANIPGLHIVFAWILADKALKMQMQNRYHTVSKPIALILSLFPPACVIYLQHAINEHWLLHAKSALIKQNI
jgi:hypothetical protein